MEGRLAQHIDALSAEKLALDLPVGPTIGRGAYNHLYISTAPAIKIQKNSGSKTVNLPVVIREWKPVKRARITNNDNSHTAQKLLEEAAKLNGNSPFIMTSIYRSRNLKKMVSLAAIDDLRHFNFHADQLRDIITQICLAVAWLHRNNLAHHDIKPENILVFITDDGRVHIRLTDLDMLTDASAKIRKGTRIFLDPDETNNDGKSLDCYALGKTLLELLHRAGSRDTNLHEIIVGLTTKNRSARSTIEDVLDNKYFGQRKVDRDKYFNELITYFGERTPLIEGQTTFYPPLDDATLLMPQPVRELVSVTHKISRTLHPAKRDAKTTADLVRKKYDMETTIIKQSKLQGYIPPVKKMVVTTCDLHDESEKNICKTITAAALQKIVDQSVKEYVEKQHSAMTRFFFHGETGKKKALEVKANTDLLVQYNHSAREIFYYLSNHLQNGSGNWRDASFKTILAKNLGTLCQLPFGEWFQHLNDAKPGAVVSARSR
jgi:tRNA A-37 threonylcarbamoyl transferase component Bud32